MKSALTVGVGLIFYAPCEWQQNGQKISGKITSGCDFQLAQHYDMTAPAKPSTFISVSYALQFLPATSVPVNHPVPETPFPVF